MLNQPTGLPTKKDIAAATEAARNNVSILEAEYARLDRLILGQKRELVTQENSKQYLEEEIERLSKQKGELAAEIEKEKAQQKEIANQNTTESEHLSKKRKELEAFELEINERERVLLGKEESLAKEAEFVRVGYDKLTAREAVLTAIDTELKEILSKL